MKRIEEENVESVVCPRCGQEVIKEAIICPFCKFGILAWLEGEINGSGDAVENQVALFKSKYSSGWIDS